MSERMSLDEQEAIRTASEHLETYRGNPTYVVTGTYNASGRWRVTFDVDGIDDDVVVRIDDESGKLASESGHRKTSENLRP